MVLYKATKRTKRVKRNSPKKFLRPYTKTCRICGHDIPRQIQAHRINQLGFVCGGACIALGTAAIGSVGTVVSGIFKGGGKKRKNSRRRRRDYDDDDEYYDDDEDYDDY